MELLGSRLDRHTLSAPLGRIVGGTVGAIPGIVGLVSLEPDFFDDFMVGSIAAALVGTITGAFLGGMARGGLFAGFVGGLGGAMVGFVVQVIVFWYSITRLL